MILIFIKCNSSSRDNSIIIIKALIRIIVYDLDVINNYSNKSFYNYYAVIPRGTISFYLNKDHLLLFYFILRLFFIPSFIGSFCLNIIFRYFRGWRHHRVGDRSAPGCSQVCRSSVGQSSASLQCPPSPTEDSYRGQTEEGGGRDWA